MPRHEWVSELTKKNLSKIKILILVGGFEHVKHPKTLISLSEMCSDVFQTKKLLMMVISNTFQTIQEADIVIDFTTTSIQQK